MSELAAAFANSLRDDLPGPAKFWKGAPPYNFVGGNNAPEVVPVADMVDSITTVLNREGENLAIYYLNSGPLGYKPLRQYLADKLGRDCAMTCTADEILMTSGSLQGIDLINAAMLKPGDSIVIEESNYGGVLTRSKRLGVNMIPMPVDEEGMRTSDLAAKLAELEQAGAPKPKYIYTIPTVHNPTATVMSEARRRELVDIAAKFQIPIFEDDCYADLTWDGARPPALHALDKNGLTAYVGTFSKSIAPALRVGFVVAPWPFLARLIPLKTDAGSGALEQMMLAEYCPKHFDTHIKRQRTALKDKLDNLTDALAASFGTTVEYAAPKGGFSSGSAFLKTSIRQALPRRPQKPALPSTPGPNGP